MDFWYVNVFVVERCADIRRDVAEYRQLQQALPDRGWFGQRMLLLGLWLVDVGESLCQRYGVSGVNPALKGF